GQVTALDASLPTTATDAQRVKWRFQTHSPVHIGYRQIRTQPLIADVNGDLQQDVVVGTSDGYVYALNGATGQELWHVRTFAGTMDTVWPDEQGRNVTESHYEEVRGLAVGNLFGRDRTRATIVVCSATLQTEDAKPRGHVLVLDCGSGTWNPELADWPQWGR
ncbi:MAG TPA: PQQ-binding-like beta-propeller repeat protein, partial [Armatimonadota bacterium]|nr:PQQ-binding-like beta-propeller repeat protein [Armatimonadota bacterium]